MNRIPRDSIDDRAPNSANGLGAPFNKWVAGRI